MIFHAILLNDVVNFLWIVLGLRKETKFWFYQFLSHLFNTIYIIFNACHLLSIQKFSIHQYVLIECFKFWKKVLKYYVFNSCLYSLLWYEFFFIVKTKTDEFEVWKKKLFSIKSIKWLFCSLVLRFDFMYTQVF